MAGRIYVWDPSIALCAKTAPRGRPETHGDRTTT